MGKKVFPETDPGCFTVVALPATFLLFLVIAVVLHAS